MTDHFDGLNLHMGNLFRLSPAKSRSISPENFTGAKGEGGMATEGISAECARELGQGWKVSPAVRIAGGTTFDLADIDGPGCIQQIWMTPTGKWRDLIIRFYWDDQEHPSVEAPVGDFFCAPYNRYAQLSSLAVCANPHSGFNSYWQMPFRSRCRITVENCAPDEAVLYYQVNYCLTDVPEDAAYFHAQFRRTNPVPHAEVHTILDGVRGSGHYVGTACAWGANHNGWWGEGEVKFFMDGDEWPTICGTGLEDYFCGSYGFYRHGMSGDHVPFTTPYAGMHDVDDPSAPGAPFGHAKTRFALYRWHILDPVRFESDLRVTVQALGWRSGFRYHSRRDDVATVAYWYQTLPTAPFPELGDRNSLEIV